ncbi:MAG: SusD/RagB family nutrient-binding outer membrane lipoprotein [Candidatus Symbiothrix sp.]|nr:SusD/RagB family nutrient-binding outer membrane lipoprotein [Candidatus Symbiothrix sp.]
MKRINKLLIIAWMAFTAVSCMDLDINVDPDTPTSTSGNVASRIPAIEFWMGHTHQTTGVFAALINQQITLSNRGDRYGSLAEWSATNNTASTYPYQAFFVGLGGTLPDVYAMAEKEGAYHYMGLVKLFRAMGFMVMSDVYGEMPYVNALTAEINPIYDDGKTIFNGVLAEIDAAIEFFKKTQESGATPLSDGDVWNGGDINKWIKLAYGMKARYLNNLSKKTDLYNPDAILAALENAPKSNADNTVIKHENAVVAQADHLWGDDVKTNYTYIWVMNWSRVYYVTKWYADILTNFDSKGIVDPRADKLIPSTQFKGGTEWFRTVGVDMQSNIRVGTNFRSPGTYNAQTKTWTVTATQDSTVVSLQTKGIHSPNYRDVAEDGVILNTGTFYARSDAPTHLLCYPEMCFIKAEVLFRKGDKAGAYTAYKEGIKAHIDLLNENLVDSDPNISKTKIPASDRDAYLSSAAIGTSNDLTLGKIMTQKFIALSFSNQNWNDMRRLDYGLAGGVAPGAYPGWAEPYEHATAFVDLKWIPAGKQYRRLGYVSHEFNYNNANLAASHKRALSDDIRSYPVWWDCATDEEYYGYIK